MDSLRHSLSPIKGPSVSRLKIDGPLHPYQDMGPPPRFLIAHRQTTSHSGRGGYPLTVASYMPVALFACDGVHHRSIAPCLGLHRFYRNPH